jgi:hypothetical protein
MYKLLCRITGLGERSVRIFSGGSVLFAVCLMAIYIARGKIHSVGHGALLAIGMFLTFFVIFCVVFRLFGGPKHR